MEIEFPQSVDKVTTSPPYRDRDQLKSMTLGLIGCKLSPFASSRSKGQSKEIERQSNNGWSLE